MKHLKPFNEAQMQLSPDRVSDIEDEMVKMAQFFKLKLEYIDGLLNELNNFQSDSKKSNDQIDDSIANLQLISKNISDSLSNIDNVANNMKNYNDKGSQFLY